MPRPSLLLWLLACLALGCSARPPPAPAPQATALRLAADRWPPFTDTRDHERLAIELVEAALRRAGYAAKTQIVPAGALPRVLLEGGFDGSPAVWRDKQREQVLLFSDAYFENRLVLIGRAESDLSVQTFAQLSGKKVGIMEFYAYGPELEAPVGPVFIKAVTLREALRGLAHGDLDYVLADSFVAQRALPECPESERALLRVGNHALLTRSLHLALRKDHPGAQRVMEHFNQVLAEHRRDGSLERMFGAGRDR